MPNLTIDLSIGLVRIKSANLWPYLMYVFCSQFGPSVNSQSLNTTHSGFVSPYTSLATQHGVGDGDGGVGDGDGDGGVGDGDGGVGEGGDGGGAVGGAAGGLDGVVVEVEVVEVVVVG